MALRFCSAFRITSDVAVLAVARMIHVDILARRMTQCTMQDVWKSTQNAGKRQCESRIIPGNVVGMNLRRVCRHRLIFNMCGLSGNIGETNYYITHFLTGHCGCFRQYLPRFGLGDSPSFPRCVIIWEDLEYTMFRCPRFAMERV